MGEPSHTPGPWVVHPLMAWVSPADNIEMPICQLRRETAGELADERVTFADARLIAAAPDLLEALIGIHHMLWGRPDIVNALRPLMGFAEDAISNKAAEALRKAGVEALS